MLLLGLGVALIYFFIRLIGGDSLLFRWWCVAWSLPAVISAPLDMPAFEGLSGAFVFILIATLLLGVGSLIASLSSSTHVVTAVDSGLENGIRACLWMSVLISMVSVQLLLIDLGASFRIFLSVEDLISNAVAASVARYHEDFNPAFRTRVLLCFLYLSGFLAGWLLACSKSAWRFAEALIAFLPALAWMVLLTTKASILFWLIFAASGFLSFASQETIKRSMGLFIAMPLIIGALAALLFWTQLSRYGGDMVDAKYVYANVSVYALGHMFAFREWFDQNLIWLPERFGAGSFAGIAELFGGDVRQAGLYAHADTYIGDTSTNVYSSLRPLIEDVGIFMALIVFLWLGFMGSKLERTSTLINRAILACMLAWVLWSPITSVYNYNSIILSCLLLIFISVFVTYSTTKRVHISEAV